MMLLGEPRSPRQPAWVEMVLGVFVGLVIGLALTTAFLTSRLPTVGGDRVPFDMRCQEDELIGVSPWGIRCWHVDEIRD